MIKHLFDKILPAIENQKKSTDQSTEATRANTAATKSADKYLRDRNGRDAKMHKELIASIKEIPRQIIKTAEDTAHTLVDTPISQIVKKQEVETQIVNGKKK